MWLIARCGELCALIVVGARTTYHSADAKRSAGTLERLELSSSSGSQQQQPELVSELEQQQLPAC